MNYVTTWNYAHNNKPIIGEKCIFHLKKQNDDDWVAGYYMPDNSIMISNEIVDYSEVEYWMRIPKIPWAI